MLIIEPSSIQDLEIFINLGEKSVKNTLISLFKCETYGGSICLLPFCFILIFLDRMLRSNLIQPSNNIETINERLDVVEEFLLKKNVFLESKKSLIFFLWL